MEPNILKEIEELIESIQGREELRIEIIITKSDDKKGNLEIKDLTVKSSNNNDLIEKRVTETLRELGVPVHLEGYGYIRNAIIIGINNPQILKNITKGLYPEIARINQTTSSKVERAVRYAIENSWKKDANRGLKRTLFQTSIDEKKDKPTNSHYISTIVDYIKHLN